MLDTKEVEAEAETKLKPQDGTAVTVEQNDILAIKMGHKAVDKAITRHPNCMGHHRLTRVFPNAITARSYGSLNSNATQSSANQVIAPATNMRYGGAPQLHGGRHTRHAGNFNQGAM